MDHSENSKYCDNIVTEIVTEKKKEKKTPETAFFQKEYKFLQNLQLIKQVIK